MRHCTFVVALVGGLAAFAGVRSVRGVEIFSETEASKYGLTRPWFAQVQLDPSRGRIQSVILDSGTLFVQTDEAILQAFDGDTGKPLWVTEVGSRDYPTTTPGVSQRLVALANGVDLYALNRYNGKIVWKVKLQGAPSAGPAVSQQRIWVPLVNGMVDAYRIKPVKRTPSQLDLINPDQLSPQQRAKRDQDRHDAFRLEQAAAAPMRCSTPGRPMVRPLVTHESPSEEFAAWSTDKGYLCMARVNRNIEGGIELRYRLQTDAPIVAEPAYLPPNPAVLGDSGVIYAASQDGFVHAIREKDGKHLWRFSTGNPIAQSPVVIGPYVLVTNQLGGMFCLNAKTGAQVWSSPEITQFIAASKQRVYASDKIGRIHVLSAPTGARLVTMPAEFLPIKVVNTESDRIYLANKTGTLLCLHEVELSQKVVRRQAALEPEDVFDVKLAAKSAAEEKPAEKPAAKTASAPRSSGGASSRPSTTPKTAGTKKSGRGGAGEYPMGGDTTGGKRSKRSGGSKMPPGYGMPPMGGEVPQGAGSGRGQPGARGRGQ